VLHLHIIYILINYILRKQNKLTNKILFLDIDGVLNNHKMWLKGGGKAYKYFDVNCIDVLNEIIERTNCKVVVTSLWRMGDSIESLLAKLTNDGYKYDILDYTPILDHPYSVRGNEIKAWLSCHTNVRRYVIVDDDADMLLEHKDHFYQTDGSVGLTSVAGERIIEMFKIPIIDI